MIIVDELIVVALKMAPWGGCAMSVRYFQIRMQQLNARGRLGGGKWGGGAHWALEPREVILKSQIWKIQKLT